MTGITVEGSVLLFNMAFAIIFCLAVFCMGREFVRRTDIVLLAVFLAATGPRLIDTSCWVGSARTPLVVLMTLTVFLCLRASSPHQLRLLVVAGLMAFGAFACHHMAVLILLYGVAYVLCVIGAKHITKSAVFGKRWSMDTYYALVVTTISVTSFIAFDSLWQSVKSSFGSDYIFDFEPNVAATLLNMAASYTHQIGLVLPVAVVGGALLLHRIGTSPRNSFLILGLIVFIPLLGKSLYVSLLLLPSVSILGSIVIYRLIGTRPAWTRRFTVGVVALACFSLLLPIASVNQWNAGEYVSGDTVEVDSQVFNDAAYLRAYSGDSFVISNTEILSLEITSFSESHLLRDGLYSVLNGEVTSEDLKSKVRLAEIGFPNNLYLWFVYDGDENANYYVLGLMTKGLDFAGPSYGDTGARSYFSSHSKLYVIIDHHWLNSYVTEYGTYGAILPSELKSATRNGETENAAIDSYNMYQSSRITLYALSLTV
jgi:hypothetical protein